ncbi:uncharacterized protein LOC113796030 [Dermatophagoides pteronyssinus]|uniref:uncharacterized protein LOC113796030 n=1 Tax=Dermatophagoides pteronyssinus TaxID=6956 RepID=UPI003F67154E
MDEQNLQVDQMIATSERFQSLESKINHLTIDLDKKNIALNDLNFHNQNLIKENNEIKMELSNIQNNCHSQLLSVKNLLQTNQNNGQNINNDQIINMIDMIIKNTMSSTSTHKIHNDDNVFFEMIESKSKLFRYENELPCLRDKNEILDTMIRSKNDYIKDLLKFIVEQRKQHETIVDSLENELKIQNKNNDMIRHELDNSKSKCQTLEIESAESKQQIADLSDRLQKSEESRQKIIDEYDQKYRIKTDECDSLKLEIEKLNNVFEKSKTEMLEKYLEKFYPNITMFSQIFDRNRSVSQLYSQFLQTETMNKNLLIEKTVLEDRVQSLTKQLDDMERSTTNLMNEIQRLKRMEDKMLKIETENKELAISLKFYQNSAHLLHNGAKTFHDNFQNLSNRINILVKHETNQINDQDTVNNGNNDSTGMMALKYVMELQNKFQEFHQLQTEFERQKLNFINEKQNIIESENRIDSLMQRIAMLEMEKQQWQATNGVLQSEYDVLQSLMTSIKTEYHEEKRKLEQTISELEMTNKSLQESIQKSNDKLNMSDDEQKTLKSIRDELENRLDLQSKQMISMEKRLKLQVKRLEQLEKSDDELRKINEQLRQSKEMAEKNWQIMSEQADDYRRRLIRMETELNGCESKMELWKRKQQYFLERLSTLYNDSERNDRMTMIIQSMTENKCSIDDELLRSIERMKMKIENRNESLETQRQQWNEEKLIFTEKILQLENDLRNEINRNLELENHFVSQQQQQPVKDGNDIMAERFEALTKELNELKQKILTSDQQYRKLLEEKLKIESEFTVVNDEKSRILAESNQIKQKFEMKIDQQQSQMKRELERYNQDLSVSQTVLMAKNSAIELLEKKIEMTEKTVKELQKELSDKSDECQRLQLQRQQLRSAQIETEILQTKLQRMEQQTNECQKQIEDQQKNLIELKMQKTIQEKRYDERLNLLRSDVEQLRLEKLDLIQANEKLNHDLGHLICSFSLEKNPAKHIDEEVKNVIENLTGQNKSLLNKSKTFELHSERMRNEIDSMRMTIINLEQCIQREKLDSEQMKQLLQKEFEQKTKSIDLNREFQENFQKIRNENEELTRKCNQLSLEIERLRQEDSREKVADAGVIATLQSQLQQTESNNQELKTKLTDLDVKYRKSEQDLADIKSKYSQQTTELESLRKELATINKKYDESEKQLESIRNELSSVQTINQQLKNLARKYKSQCEKQQQQQQSGSKETQQQQQLDLENNNALEMRIQNLNDENEKLKEQISQLQMEIIQCRQQTEQSKQKARSIGQQAKNRLSNMEKLLNERDKEINFLRSIISDKSKIIDPSSVVNQQPIAGCSHSSGQSVSSTIVSASSNRLHQQQPSTSSSSSSSSSTTSSTSSSSTTMTMTKTMNQQRHHQPSSSSGSQNEDNDTDNNRLQSAQISSHTTSMMDDNSMESSSLASTSTSSFFPTTNIPSTSSLSSSNNHKRRIQSLSPGNQEHQELGVKILLKKKRIDNIIDNINNMNSENSTNQTINIQQQPLNLDNQNADNNDNDDDDEDEMEEAEQSSPLVIQVDDDDDDDDEVEQSINDDQIDHNEQEQIVDQSHQQLEPEEEDHHTESNDGSYPEDTDASSSNNNNNNHDHDNNDDNNNQ